MEELTSLDNEIDQKQLTYKERLRWQTECNTLFTGKEEKKKRQLKSSEFGEHVCGQKHTFQTLRLCKREINNEFKKKKKCNYPSEAADKEKIK